MNDNPLTLDQVQALAAAIGLTHLSQEHLQQLQQVTNVKRNQDLAALLKDLDPADEPASAFTAG
jgi:mannitol/fructose-specific phosphotransferase system IIA component